MMEFLSQAPPFLVFFAALGFTAALVIPFRMLVRLPWVRRLYLRAHARSSQMGILFWVLFATSYLLIAWLIFWGYAVAYGF
ncbi:MAG: hypothetical protein AAGI38_17020 [Bacteroidota bacterium]